MLIVQISATTSNLLVTGERKEANFLPRAGYSIDHRDVVSSTRATTWILAIRRSSSARHADKSYSKAQR